MYQIIPRKFRPQSFADVVGHEEIVTLLQNALRLGRVAQVYLFYGSHGTGKTTLARLFAKVLNCQNPIHAEPCNECISCMQMQEGRSLDILEIDGASNRGIDDIRKINETIGYATHLGKYKIYIIDEVHMLTKEAFSALLKTLEEPPSFVKFFFATTEPDKIPPSIKSRSQLLQLKRLSLASIQCKLTHISTTLKLPIEEAAIAQIAQIAEGSLRDAESLLDQLACYSEGPITLDKARELLGLLPSHFFAALDEAIFSEQIEKARQLASECFLNGKDQHAILSSLQSHFHAHLLNPSSPYSTKQSLQFLDLLLEAEQQAIKIPFRRIHIEMLFINLVKSRTRIPLSELIERLLALEERIKQPLNEIPSEDKSIAPIQKEIDTSEAKEKSAIQPTSSLKPQSHYDTLLRFAAVELEGTLKMFH